MQYTTTRLFILGSRSPSGSGSGSGSRRRERAWSSGLASTTARWSRAGINIQLTFAIAFFVGSALAGLGGVMGGSFASLAPGVDSNWLLNSLVVVIIGGMGSLSGAAVGALLLGLTSELRRRLSAVRLHVLLDHLHVHAAGHRAGGSAARSVRAASVSRRALRRRPRRSAGGTLALAAARAAHLHATTGSAALLTQTLFLGIVASSLIFLSAYGGMVSLAQVALYGIAGFVARQRGHERQREGAQPGLEPMAGRR